MFIGFSFNCSCDASSSFCARSTAARERLKINVQRPHGRLHFRCFRVALGLCLRQCLSNIQSNGKRRGGCSSTSRSDRFCLVDLLKLGDCRTMCADVATRAAARYRRADALDAIVIGQCKYTVGGKHGHFSLAANQCRSCNQKIECPLARPIEMIEHGDKTRETIGALYEAEACHRERKALAEIARINGMPISAKVAHRGGFELVEVVVLSDDENLPTQCRFPRPACPASSTAPRQAMRSRPSGRPVQPVPIAPARSRHRVPQAGCVA